MRFFSQHLLSTEYRNALRTDLSQATVCRFLVAYVSIEGIKALDWAHVSRALRHPGSFGVACQWLGGGVGPLVENQNKKGAAAGGRLKYFMDPLVDEDDEPEDFALFHSKLVYLYLEGSGKVGRICGIT